MGKKLQGKVALVTGASRGIGRSIACKLGKMGAAVVVNYLQDSTRAEEVVAEIIADGGEAIALQADMKKVKRIKSLYSKSLEQYGRLDIVVNNAGMLLNRMMLDSTEEEFDEIVALNVKGVFFSCKEAAAVMADGGRIINISSTVTTMPLATYGLYSATKGAVEQLTGVLAKELGSREITVNTISPGPVDTELFRRGKSEEQIMNLAAMSAFGRLGSPVDIADAVSLLVRDEAAWISGQNIFANGGMAG